MSRPEGRPATIGELIGKQHKQVTPENLEEVMGLRMPSLSMDNVGKIRLLKAFRNRFGESFRNVPGVKEILTGFDKEIRLNRLIQMNKKGRK